jgi:hypothetical protein
MAGLRLARISYGVGCSINLVLIPERALVFPVFSGLPVSWLVCGTLGRGSPS